MGGFHVPIEVGDSRGERYESIDVLVDTGATYTILPASTLRRLEIEPEESGPFELADAGVRDFEIGQARVRVNGHEIATVVVFGEEGMTPLLGAYALERLRLAAYPAGRRLVSVPWRGFAP